MSMLRSYLEIFPREREKIAGQSRILLMTLPSIVRVNDRFRLKVCMMNVSGMPDESFVGKVALRPSGTGLDAPSEVIFRPDDHGRVVVPDLACKQAGVYYIEGDVEGSPSKPPRSNPVKAVPNPKDGLFWGDIHFHSVLGNCNADCAKDPEFGYWYASEVAHLDFAAVTDHLRGLDAGRWSRTVDLARAYNRPGEFVSFLGFESSHSKDHGGDINVYYLGDEAEYFWLDREDMKGISPKVGLDVLWRWLDERGKPYTTIPHHTGRAAKYRDFELPYYGLDREPVFEVFSMWGCSEAENDGFCLKGGKTSRRAYLQDALRMGYRYGVIGSSDNHFTMPGTPCSILPRPYHHPANKMVNQGLAAVYAPELSRQALFDSLTARRCYATTSTRPILDLSVDSAGMGQTLIAQADEVPPRRIVIELCTSIFPATMELIRNNQVIANLSVDEAHTISTYVDETNANDLWIKDAPMNRAPFFYYYVRVRYPSLYAGITAWSSPIWIQRA